MMAAFMKDLAAPGSRATVESHWSTWTAFHEGWFGRQVPVLPLTTAKIFAVAACFKDGGHRAFRSFAGKAREVHILEGHPWDEELDLARRKASLSVLRGLGVARQSAPFDIVLALNVCKENKVIFPPGAPVGWSNLITMATFFIMRELEVAAALASHIQIDNEISKVTLRLPISKTDSRAAGCSRSWDCLCPSSGRRVDCPFHAATDQLQLLKEKFGEVLPQTLPLFPTIDGDTVAKAVIVETLERTVAATGAKIVSENGGRLLGGHSFRVSGAQRLAALGVEVAKIMIMARWAGESVLRYVQEAPLETLPKEVIALEEQRNLVTTLRALRKEVHELSTKVVDTEAAGEVKVKNLEARIASVSADMVQRVVAEPDRIIIARVARRYKYKVHTAFGNDFQAPPADWKTKCGRSFGLWNFTRHERIDEFPADARCRFCFGGLPQEPRCVSDSGDSSSSSSSS